MTNYTSVVPICRDALISHIDLLIFVLTKNYIDFKSLVTIWRASGWNCYAWC